MRHALLMASIAGLIAHRDLEPVNALCNIELLPSSGSVQGPSTRGPMGAALRNFSVAAQLPAATVRTYLTGSQLLIPGPGLKVGTTFRWRFNMTKTAAGSAASTFDIAVGALGTAADTARVSFVKPAGTAAIDEAWCEVNATVRVVSLTVGVIVGTFTLGHNLAATGHAVIPFVAVSTISANFDNKTYPATGLFVGLCVTTGAADVITIEQMSAEANNL